MAIAVAVVAVGCSPTPPITDASSASTTPTPAPSETSRSAPGPARDLVADLQSGEKLIFERVLDGSPIDPTEVGSTSFAIYVECVGGGDISVGYEGADSPFKAPCDGVPTRVEIHLESAPTTLSVADVDGKSGQLVVART